PVAAETALAMAAGVRSRLHADVGVATTGVAGPDRQDDLPPGTVHVAVAGPDGARCASFVGPDRLTGDRAQIRAATVDAALELLRRELAEPES
ncbi:MAG: CinA family protein, partial [Jiangellaceae bacterium]